MNAQTAQAHGGKILTGHVRVTGLSGWHLNGFFTKHMCDKDPSEGKDSSTMTLLLEDCWVEALDDEQRSVRSLALNVVSKEVNPPVDAMAHVMSRIDRDGWENAYEFSHQIQDFPHNESSIDWVVERLTNSLQATPAVEDSSLRFLMAWFLDAPPALLESRIGRVSAALEAYRPPGGKPLQLGSPTGPQPASLAPARERLELATASLETLMEALEETIASCVTFQDEFPTLEVQRLDRICEALGKCGTVPAETLASWLEVDLEEDPDDRLPDADWRAGAAVEILCHGDAPLPVDTLIRWLISDWDWMNERIGKTLSKRADEAVMARIMDTYPTLDWAARLFLTDVIERARFASLEPMIRDLARKEQAADLKADLAATLLLYGSAESIELAREIQWRNAGKGQQEHLKDLLAVHEWLTGTRSSKVVRQIEEMDRRARRLRIKMAEFDRMMDEPVDDTQSDRILTMTSLAIPHPADSSHVGVGRNEPCPCGSGRKFKKCCGS